MNMFDEARSIKGMMEMLGATQNEMAKKLGVSQSYIANKLRLLKLDSSCEMAVIKGGLSERHARAALRLVGDEERLAVLSKMAADRLTVSQGEALVDLRHTGQAPKIIGGAQRCEATAAFFESISLSVKSLVSLGISAKESISYYGKKAYVTVCIEEC